MQAISKWDEGELDPPASKKNSHTALDNDNLAGANTLPPAWQSFRHKAKLMRQFTTAEGSTKTNPDRDSAASNLDKQNSGKKTKRRLKGGRGSASKGGRIRPEELIHESLKNDSTVMGVSIAPGGKHVAIGLMASAIVKPLSRFQRPKRPVQIDTKRKKPRQVTAIDLGTSIMATGYKDGCITIHNLFGEKLTSCSSNPGKILSCAVSADDSMVAYGGGGYGGQEKRGWFRVLDAERGNLLFAMKAGASRHEDWSLDETIAVDEKKRSRSKSSYKLSKKKTTSMKPLRKGSLDASGQPKRHQSFASNLMHAGSDTAKRLVTKNNGAKNKWMKAKKNVMGVTMAGFGRQAKPNFDSSVRCCKLSAPVRGRSSQTAAPCLLATGGRDQAVLIWEVPQLPRVKKYLTLATDLDKKRKQFDKDKSSLDQKSLEKRLKEVVEAEEKLNRAKKKIQDAWLSAEKSTSTKRTTIVLMPLNILYCFPIRSWCTCMCFSEDASFFGYGTTNGRLRLHETINGAQFQVFQPIDLTGPKLQDDGGSNVMADGNDSKLKKNHQSDGMGGAVHSQARVAQCTLLVDDDAPQDSASYDDDLVVYVLEQKVDGKRWAAHVVVRDVISAAILHTYCVTGAQSSVALWASPQRVVVVARPTRVRSRDLIMHVHDLDAGMVWQSIRHGEGAASKTAITGCCLSEDGEYLAIADATEKVTVYNADDGVAIIAYSQGAKCLAVVFSPNTKYLATGGNDKKNGRLVTGLLVMRKVETNRTPVSSPTSSSRRGSESNADLFGDSNDRDGVCWEQQHPGPVTDISFCEGGAWLAVTDGGVGEHIYIQEATRQRNEDVSSPGSPGKPHKKVTRTSTIKIYQTTTGVLLQELEFGAGAFHVDCQRHSLNGEILMAAVGEGGLLNLWVTTLDGKSNFENVTSRLDRHDDDHQHHCTVVAFSPDGHYLATGDSEGQVILREFVEHSRKSLKYV